MLICVFVDVTFVIIDARREGVHASANLSSLKMSLMGWGGWGVPQLISMSLNLPFFFFEVVPNGCFREGQLKGFSCLSIKVACAYKKFQGNTWLA